MQKAGFYPAFLKASFQTLFLNILFANDSHPSQHYLLIHGLHFPNGDVGPIGDSSVSGRSGKDVAALFQNNEISSVKVSQGSGKDPFIERIQYLHFRESHWFSI